MARDSRLRLAFHALPGALALALYAIVVAPISRLRRTRRDRPAILWGPTAIENNRNAALADRRYGYRSETIAYRLYRPSHRAAFDHAPSVVRVRGVGQLVPYWAFLWAGLRFDVFCFTFEGGLLGETPFWRAELPLLRLAGKKVIVYPYGGDARLPSTTRARGGWHAYSLIEPGDEDRDEADVRARLDAFGRADLVLGCADLVEDLPRLDGIYQYPFDASGWEPAAPSGGEAVRIVHASNHRHYKGTEFLIDAVERLRGEGLAIDLVLVEGVPNEEARDLYRTADVIADQFLLGAYALFAIEGMALGKPIVCYLNDRLAAHHPEWAECPIVSASPDTLVDELRRLVLDPELRRELGRGGPDYVRRIHSLDAVGAQMDERYRRLWRTD